MKNIKAIFRTKRPIIGAIHFMPLLGYENYQGLDKILDIALQDLKVLEEGGVDGIIVENNYDVPHKIFVDPEIIACMTYLTTEIVKRTKLPVGVSVLWNDYKAALSIAKISGGKFIRVPVFVDDVETQYGDVFGEPDKVIKYRNMIKANEVVILTDIHVKHARLLSEYSLSVSAKKAVQKGSDGIIITGKWTGNAPNLDDLDLVRRTVGSFPIFVGSGADLKNIKDLTSYTDGVIVSTSLKTGKNNMENVNIRGEEERIDKKRVRLFVKEFKKQ